ncbi:AMP-binding protein [Moritella dasanensis]|uniref:AMP-binding protein n=1 Tax=Moritella dasanensis TaxID=428031 RepID=UPI0002F28C18
MNALLTCIYNYGLTQPDAIAFVGYRVASTALVELTYTQLCQQIEETKAALLDLNPRCIALRAANSIDWAMLDLAALAANITIVPIPLFFTPQQVDHALNESGADLFIGDWSDNSLRSKATRLEVTLLGMPLYTTSKPVTATEFPDKCVKITFTSGSTGNPKGVCLSALHLETVTQSLLDTISQGQIPQSHLVLLPLTTLLENITGIYVPLMLGVRTIILPGEQVGLIGSSQFEAPTFMQALLTFTPQSLVLTPALLGALIQTVQSQPEIAKRLVFVAVGGARVPSSIMDLAHQLNIPAYEGYGLSECGSVVSLNHPAAFQFGSCGQVLPHCQVEIACDGEVLVFGASMLGYLGDDTKPQYIETGDIGYLDSDGFLHITGRKKNLVITPFGRNISPEWIESEAQVYPAIRNMVVMGDQDDQLLAVISTSTASTEEPGKVRDAITQLNQTLPDYAALSRWRLVDSFSQYPHLFTANGRPKRDAFQLQFSKQANTLDLSSSDSNKVNIMTSTPLFFEQLKQATQQQQDLMYQAPIFAACQQGDISLANYTAFLTQAFHHVKHTVPLLMACGSRLPEKYEWLQSAIGEYIEEEKGHHEWILNDIRACGANADDVRHDQHQGKACQAIELMVAYLYHQIDRKNPLAFFGMVWVLEGTSVTVGGSIAALVQSKLVLPDAAMSYLTSHSTLDQEHIQTFEKLMNNITDTDDQQAIIAGANMVFTLYGDMLKSLSATH